MKLTDEQLHTLIASNPSDPEALAELRSRTIWKLYRLLPAPTGTCSAGLPVMLDCKGAYSTGYWLHSCAGVGMYCNHGDKVTMDPDSPRAARLKRAIAGIYLDKRPPRP